MPASHSRPTADRVRKHRQFLRAQGLKPLQIWVPDVAAPAFAAAASVQSRLIAASSAERGDQAFVDALSVLSDE